MRQHAAFLRGINLGRRRVKMADLRRHFEPLAVENVATFIASGNVIFKVAERDLSDLEERIEHHLQNALGYPVETFIRPMDALRGVLESGTVRDAREAGFTPYAIFLKEEVARSAEARLAALETPDDAFRVLGREVLWLRRGRLSDSSIETRHLEKALGGVGQTMRKLNTIRRMVEKFGSPTRDPEPTDI